jgi:hypothetical protein
VERCPLPLRRVAREIWHDVAETKNAWKMQQVVQATNQK